MNTVAIGLFLAICLAIIVAAHLLNRTRWHYCPRCHHYHNETGDRAAIPPYGKVSGHAFPCADCIQLVKK